MTRKSTKRPHTIVVGVDFEPDGDLALDEAIALAGRFGRAEVHVLYVDSKLTASAKAAGAAEMSSLGVQATRTKTVLDRLETLCADRLELATTACEDLHFDRAVTHLRLGDPATHIVQLAVDLDADLIVVGTHSRRGLKRLVLGSVAEKVTRIARCPVYVVRAKDHAEVGDVPEVEPPCTKCIAERSATGGAEMWCAQHRLAKNHPRMHCYSYGGPLSDSFHPSTDTTSSMRSGGGTS